MDEEFFLADFSLEDVDFDFNIYEEINVSPNEAKMHTQRAQYSSNFDHQMRLEFVREKPKPTMKQMKKINNKPRVISFDFSSHVSSCEAKEEIIMDQLAGRGTKIKASSLGTRSHSLAKEHILAERKRREKLSQKFIALSALLPDLKKADKVTVLDYAISHMKQLQEQIRKLKVEKEATREMESMILVKKSIVFIDEDQTYLSTCPLDHKKLDQAFPEIEAKVAQKEVLIRIHCEKSKGCMINILNTIETFRLRIVNSTSLPFGDSALDITVLAQLQMEKEFSANVLKDLVRNLRLATV